MFDHTHTNDTDLLLKQAQALLEDESDLIANCANLAALIYNNIEGLNWAGFYIYKDGDLVLGPFQGLSACTRIKMGKGVCGTSALDRRVLNIKDVHEFPGHIACDSASNSELVIPIINNDNLIAVLDLDSPEFNRFDHEIQIFFEEIVKLLILKTEFTA